MQRNVNLTFCLGLVLLAAGCDEPDRDDTPQRGIDHQPTITSDLNGMDSMEISVLVFNVAGLPFPLGCGKSSRSTDESGERIPIACDRSEAVKDIGDSLAELRRAGTEPDVIMLQEAFIEATAEIPERGGYPNWVAGPTSEDLGPEYSMRASDDFIADRSFWKGEKLGKWQSSGLVFASNYPIQVRYSHPFNQWECAGFDCLANKGILTVELDIPGLPDPLAIATTHFNSRGASGVSSDRARDAHNLQVDEVNEHLDELGRPYLPFIWGGDLNMRHAEDRIEYFVERSMGALNEVSSYCTDNPDDCEVLIKWGTDTPWYDTQDLQGWSPGARVDIRPIQIMEMFEDPVDGVMPSDHNGVLVRYRLTWPTTLTRPF